MSNRQRTALTLRLALVVLLTALITVPSPTQPRALAQPIETLVLDDQFTGANLNPAVWTRGDSTTNWTPMFGGNCFLSSAVTVSGGSVRITSSYTPTDFFCANPGGAGIWTNKIAGQLHTKGKFEQAYGRWEIKAKFPNATGYNHSAVWMYPKDLTYGAWPRSGEIDIVEHADLWWYPWGNNSAAQSLHYVDSSGGTSYNAGDGDGNPGESFGCAIAQPSQWNTYEISWTAQSIEFLINDVSCINMTWQAYQKDANGVLTPLTPPAPFDNPFFLILQQQTLGDSTATNARTLQVDRVRVWAYS